MSWWMVALLAWVVAIPVVTVVCVGVLRGGRLDDEARLSAHEMEPARSSELHRTL